MNFYRLTDKEYGTDQADARHNPVREMGNYSIPSQICPNCGTWGSSDRLRNLNLEGVDLEKYRDYQFIELEE